MSSFQILVEELIFLTYLFKDRNKKIAFWGASVYLENLLTKYHIKNKNIAGIIDKDLKKRGKELCGYKIYSPEQINDLDIDTVIFTIKNHNEQIYPQVRQILKNQNADIKLAPNYFNYLTNKRDKLIRNIRNKFLISKLKHKKDKIKVCFLVSEATKWNGENLYKLMENSDMFEPFFVVTANPLNITPFNEIIEFFKQISDKVYVGFDEQRKTGINILNFSPDIVFFQQPWDLFPNQNANSVSKFALSCYIPYAIEEAPYAMSVNLKSFYALLWNWFLCTDETVKQLEEFHNIRYSNMLVTGHPKLDTYNQYKEENYEHKYVIYAPHRSVEKGVGSLQYATFEWNGRYILEWAKKHPEFEWIFKPHPHLKQALVNTKIMTQDEVNNYYEEWTKIGLYYDSGNYFDLFKESKCLITDCGSFLTEYLPTKQPVIHLRSKNAKSYANLNKKIMESYYKVWNTEELEQTLDNVLIKNIDDKKEERIALLDKIFHNNFNASKNIIDTLTKELR